MNALKTYIATRNKVVAMIRVGMSRHGDSTATAQDNADRAILFNEALALALTLEDLAYKAKRYDLRGEWYSLVDTCMDEAGCFENGEHCNREALMENELFRKAQALQEIAEFSN